MLEKYIWGPACWPKTPRGGGIFATGVPLSLKASRVVHLIAVCFTPRLPQLTIHTLRVQYWAPLK
jgi:hypothetical protein